MANIRKAIIKALSKDYNHATYSVARTVEGAVSYTGTPDTNTNYGKYVAGATSTLNIDMNIQHISDDDRKNFDFNDYQSKGYIIKNSLKYKSLVKIKNKDVITYSDGLKYEVVENKDVYLPENGVNTFTYSSGLLLRKEKQS